MIVDSSIITNQPWIDLDFNYTESSLSTSQLINKSDWGPKRDPLYIVLPISFIYVTIFLTGVMGNVSTCFVIARNKSMHTATNYYLFSLAISDLLLLTSGLPTEIYLIWWKYPYVFGEPFCILQGFAAETSSNATVLTITAFTVERYVAICHPFLSHTLSKLNRAIKYIILIWIIAVCLAIPQAAAFGVVCEEYLPDDHCVCIVKQFLIPHAFEISTLVFFVAPMSIITILYVLIGVQLRRSTVRPSRANSVNLRCKVYKSATYVNTTNQTLLVMNVNDDQSNVHVVENVDEGRKNFSKNAQATKHVVKMLIAVVVAFFICWAPFHAQRLLAIYGEHTSQRTITAFQILTYISGVFYYLSTTINPLLYHIMSNKFREAFKATYKKCFRKGYRMQRNGAPGGRCYSTFSVNRSQLNSHSNTDSCSHHSSLRYLDAEMARLHDSQRPLVVSFRRKNARNQNSNETSSKHVIVLDTELREALHQLEQEKIFRKNNAARYDNDNTGGSNSNLQPTHICPLSVNN